MSRVTENLNPKAARRMFSEATNFQTLMWIGVAFVVHVIIAGATSMGYIRDRWIDPAGAAARQQAADTAAANAQSAETASATPAPTPASTAKSSDKSADDEKALLEQRTNNPEVKKLNEKAKPNEIPKDPQHQGFNLDDSSLK